MGARSCHSELGGGSLNQSTVRLEAMFQCITALIIPSVTVYLFTCLTHQAWATSDYPYSSLPACSQLICILSRWQQLGEEESRPGDWGLLPELVGPQEEVWSEQGLIGVPQDQDISTLLPLNISALVRGQKSQFPAGQTVQQAPLQEDCTGWRTQGATGHNPCSCWSQKDFRQMLFLRHLDS